MCNVNRAKHKPEILTYSVAGYNHVTYQFHHTSSEHFLKLLKSKRSAKGEDSSPACWSFFGLKKRRRAPSGKITI